MIFRLAVLTILEVSVKVSSTGNTDQLSSGFAIYWDTEGFTLDYKSNKTSSGHDDFLSWTLMNLEREFGRHVVADAIDAALENIRIAFSSQSQSPIDPLAIPNLGPFVYPDIGDKVRLKTNVNSFAVYGLSVFLVDHVSFNSLRLSANIEMTFNSLIITGRYNASAIMSGEKNYASGNFRINLSRLIAIIGLRFGTSTTKGDRCILKELKIRWFSENISYQFSGMVAPLALDKIIKEWIQKKIENIVPNKLRINAGKFIFNIINAYVVRFTLDTVVAKVERYGSEMYHSN